jgi:hypothetical protein
MTRIASVATRALGSAARVLDDVKMETVGRFGKPRREVPIEAEVYAPQIVVLFVTAAGLLSRLRAWALRRRLVRRPSSRMLVLEPARERSRSATATPGRSERQGARGATSGRPM